MRKFIDKIKPSFEKGGKFGFLHSTFDAFESFLYVPDTVTLKGSHVRDSVDLKRIMITVVVALVPCALFGIWNVGYQHNIAFDLGWGFWQMVWYGFLRVLPLYVVAYVVGLAIEFISAQIRGHEVNEGFLVSGMLIPLIVPVDVPLWMLAIAVAFAVILGKEVFGGTHTRARCPATPSGQEVSQDTSLTGPHSRAGTGLQTHSQVPLLSYMREQVEYRD